MFWCKCEKIIESYLDQVVDERVKNEQKYTELHIGYTTLDNRFYELLSKFKELEKACQTMISREQNLLQTLSEKVAKLEKASRMYVRKKGRPYRLLINKESNE